MHKNLIIIHHTAVGGNAPQFYSVNRYHKGQGFPKSRLGFYVGYQYFIEKDGRMRQARLDNETGAHTIGWNNKSIGVCLAGDFNYETPTRAQINKLKYLIKIKDAEVDLHRNRQENRTCPGKLFTLDLLQDPVDSVDNDKSEKIAAFLRKHPHLAHLEAWIRRIIK